MEILGLQASPRRGGNSEYLLKAFMERARSYGARTTVLEVSRAKIKPCIELTVCEKKGTCPLRDEMADHVYGRLRRAEIVVVASPVFFYNFPAQLKALIDRSQVLWSRKYRLKLKDPKSGRRKGFLLAVGATSGARLFEGMELTARYFFDAIDAAYAGSLTYNGIEGKGQVRQVPGLEDDLNRAAADLCGPFGNRPKVLCLGKKNSGASRMAAAFMQVKAGDRLDVVSAGTSPAADIRPETVAAMAGEKIDLAFQRPRSLADLSPDFRPDYLVATTAAGETGDDPAAGRKIEWNLASNLSAEKLREEVKTRVDQFLSNLFK